MGRILNCPSTIVISTFLFFNFFLQYLILDSERSEWFYNDIKYIFYFQNRINNQMFSSDPYTSKLFPVANFVHSVL